jgi:hypothetical protein
MFRTTLAILIAATALVAMSMTTNVFASNGEEHAPDQHDIHQNPSDHLEGSIGFPPPGQGEDQNPGQCQDFFQHGGFEFDKPTARDLCHEH